MNDLEIAKKELKEGWSLVFVKDGKIIFKEKSKGVMGLVVAIDKFGSQLNNSSVADTIVGKAAACLFVISGVSSVFAGKISRNATDLLKEKNIHFEYEKFVEKILNKSETDLCPFEKISLKYQTPEEVYKEIKSFLKL